MKKSILAIVALGIGASALTGCSVFTPAPVPTVTQTVEAEPKASEKATSKATEKATDEATEEATTKSPKASGVVLTDDEFTDLVRSKTTTAYIMGNNEIVEIAKNTCETYETGGNLRNVLNDISEKFLDTTANVKMDEEAFFKDLAYIAGAGVGNYCYEYGDQFKQEVTEAIAESKARV